MGQCIMWDFFSNFPVLKNLSNEVGMKLKISLVILVKILYFKGKFWLDGRKMQKNFTLECFLNIFKEIFRVETLEKDKRRTKLFEFF